MFCRLEFPLSNSALVPFVSIVVSMEINGRHYFQGDISEEIGAGEEALRLEQFLSESLTCLPTESALGLF